MQTKVSNNSKRYIYRKNALGRDKSVMGQKDCKTNCDKTGCSEYEEV